jgi:hypothetical protein
MTAATRGMAAQFLFIAMALEFGWNPQIPACDDLEYDVLIEESDRSFTRVQVKRIYEKDGHPTVNMTRQDGSRYERNDAQWLAAVDMRAHRFYLIPWHEVYTVTRKRITDEHAHYAYTL